MRQPLFFGFDRDFFSGQTFGLGFLGSGAFFPSTNFGKALRLGALFFRPLPGGKLFASPLFSGKFGRVFHSGACAPIHFCRGRGLHATGNKRLAERHGFTRRNAFSGCLASGFIPLGGIGGQGFHAISSTFRHIQARRQGRFRISVRSSLQRRFGHKLPLLVGGPHAKIARCPFHTNNTKFFVITPLPVQAADAFSGKIGRCIQLLGPGNPIARPLKHINFTVVNFDKAENFEQPFLVQLKGGEAFGHGLAVGIGIIKFEHLGRAPGPGIAPCLHEPPQFAGRAVIWLRHDGFVQTFRQDYGRAGYKVRADLIDFFQPDGHAAPCRKRLNAQALAVYPYTVAGFAAQLVHGVGVVERIGYATVFFKIKAVGNFVFYKINALGSAKIVEHLLVASELPGGAGIGIAELERTFFLKKHEGLAILVHSHQMGR